MLSSFLGDVSPVLTDHDVQDIVGQDAFIASTAVSLGDIVTNETDCKELVVELEPSGTLKIKVQYKADAAMAPQEFRARENAFNKRKVAIKRRKIHEVCWMSFEIAVSHPLTSALLA